MKQTLTLLISVFILQTLSAQHISVKSFTKLENDMDARVHHPKRDQNGELSAIIKVVTTETGFTFDGGTLGIVASEQKVAEIWVYVPRGAQRISIMHPKLGVLRNYAFMIPIEAATVYEMHLITGRLETVIAEPEVQTQWLVVESDPPQADVYIDNIHKGQTPLQIELNTGKYSYRIEKFLYHLDAGTINLTINKRAEITAVLHPNFGYIKIATEPESGAEIRLNGTKLSGTTPITTEKLNSGTYKVSVSKDLYHDETFDVIVLDDDTTELMVLMKPNFGTINVSTTPESDASVLLNGMNTGRKTPCSFERLMSGQYQITVRKEWYQPRTIAVEVKEGTLENLEIEMQPTFGTLKVKAEHDAEIFINNERRASGNWEGRLIAGWYTVEARKDKHYSDLKRIEIKLAVGHNLSLHPKPKTGTLRLQTTPYDAQITINGNGFGRTPATIRDLLIGEYTISLSKQGYATLTHSIKIVENETVEINEILPASMQITLTSDPSGAELFINNQKVGTTPYTVELSFGSHRIKLVNRNKTIEEFIDVTQNGRSDFSFNVVEFVDPFEKQMIFVEGGTFNMGCTKEQGGDCHDWEYPTRRVMVEDFYISKYEVTQKLWREVMGSNPTKLFFHGCDDCPVESVSWNDIQGFIRELNHLTGKYYRLPSEAEWEYAARGGNLSRGFKYPGSNNVEQVVWYTSNALGKTKQVGSKKPNEQGIYDMGGNVWEWCEDDWNGNYDGAPSRARAWFGIPRGSHRVMRGGSWFDNQNSCRTSARYGGKPDDGGPHIGFRLAHSP